MNVETIIEALKTLTKAKITKADLARALNVDPAALRRKELAKIEFKPNEIKKVEHYFDVKLSQGSDFTLKVEPDNKNIKGWGRKIQKLRAENDLTVVRFSEITKIKEDDLIDYINEDKEPALDDLIKIVNHFNVTIDELLF
ncbi:helix-turn-helix transcriptional regulator [bacterium]|nr:helix-turn-helix transcriptional regulator [bacterium]